jgi:PKD repeat protein/lysophospholipase L1-like esterase
VKSLIEAVGLTCRRARWWSAVLLSLCAALIAAPGAHADQSITSAGPLTQIGVGSDLSCSVNYLGDSFPEFFEGTACGTFLDVGGPVSDGRTVYGPNDLPAEGAVQSTEFTQDGQTPVSGNGTAASPFKVSTQVDAGDTGLSMTQTDSYVTGNDAYSTSVLITNSSGQPQTVELYHGADCYLQNADFGYGLSDNASGGIFCTKTANNSPAGRVEGLVPVDGGSRYLETFYNSNWAAIGSGQPLPDTCDCSTFEDNSMAIGWTVTVPPGGAVTRSWATDFSPVGTIRASSYVALGDSVAAGEGIAENWTWNSSTGRWLKGASVPWDTTSGQSNAACHQTMQGYPHILTGLLSANLVDLGCTGAGTLNGVLGPESGKTGPQLGAASMANSAYDQAAPDVVSLTVGADDIDFKDKVAACYTPVVHACGTGGDLPAFLSQLNTFKLGLNLVLKQIQTRGVASGKMPIVALTQYYSPFPNSYPTDGSCIDINPSRTLGGTLTNPEMQYLERGLADLNDAIHDVASPYGNVFVVPAPASFAQHRWCSADPWVYGPSLEKTLAGHLADPAPFHPTPEGQNAIAQNIASYLADERHVDIGSEVPLNFGAITVLLHAVQTAGTAFFTPQGSTGAQARPAPEGSWRVTAHAVTTNAVAESGGAAPPPTRTFAPVQIYAAGTSAQYTSGLTVTLPALGASAVYEVVGGAWQLIPSTSDGTNLTADLQTLGTLALGNPEPPVTAAFTLAGNSRQAPATVSFDGSGSTVASGAINSYSWDFGDGTSATGVRVSHVYPAAGTYTATLTVNAAGASDVVTHTVTVVDRAPIARVKYPNAVTAGTVVKGFNASASHAASGRISVVYWNFGDRTKVVTGAKPTHKFARPGTYTVTTTVLDNEGAMASAKKRITVKAPSRVTFGKQLAVRKGRLALKLSCAAHGPPCQGTVKLVVKKGRGTVTLASGRFDVRAGNHKTVLLGERAERKQLAQASAITVATAKVKGSAHTLTVRLGKSKPAH